MICRNCSFDNPEGTHYCTNCGAPFTADNRQETENHSNEGFYGHNAYYSEQSQPHSNANGYYQQPPYGGYYAPPVNDKAASVKDYLKWMLLYPLINLIPVVGTVAFILLCVKFAFDSSFKARANYFKATLIAFVISIAIVILMCIVMLPLIVFFTDSAVSTIQDFDPSIFYDGNFEHYFDLLIR